MLHDLAQILHFLMPRLLRDQFVRCREIQTFLHALGADTARKTLAARFMGEELHRVMRDLHYIARIVEDDHTTGAQHGPAGAQGRFVQGRVQIRGFQETAGQPGHGHGLHGAPGWGAAGPFVDEFGQGQTERRFVVPRALNIPRDTHDLGAGPFPAAAFAAAYAGDMHDVSNRAEGLGAAVGRAGAAAVLVPAGVDRMLAAQPGSASLAARYGEAAALASPLPYELIVAAGGNRTASVPVGPYPFSSPIEYEFAAGRADGGIVLDAGAGPRTVRVSAADWFGRIAELRVDGYVVPPGGAGLQGPPCRPYCEVRVGQGGGGGAGAEGNTTIVIANAWGGTASASALPAASGAAGGPGSRVYGAAVAYAEAAVPYLAALCILAACLLAYSRAFSARRRD